MAQKSSEVHPWFDVALEFDRGRQSFCEVKFGSPEWEAWRDYFNWLNWFPVTFRMCDAKRSWTAPTKWPNDFTVRFRPAEPGNMPYQAPKSAETERPSDSALDAQFKRLGLSKLRVGSKCDTRQPRHGADERAEAQVILDRYQAEARRQPVGEAAE